MRHEPRKYLFDILDSCRFLTDFTSGRTLEDLRCDRGFRSAVERELQIIGEATNVLAKAAPAIAEQLSEHARIIRFRHVIVHGYDQLDHDILWSIVTGKLGTLQQDVQRLLAETGEAEGTDAP